MADVGNGADTTVASQPQMVTAESEETPPATSEEIQPLVQDEEQQALGKEGKEPAYGYPGGINDPVSGGGAPLAMSGSEIVCRTQLK
jgi:hypothetical protein